MTTPDPSVCYRQGELTDADYVEAIADLELARRQIAVRQWHCAICEDTGHTAEVCHHNPLLLARRQTRAEGVWRCFHCGVVCLTEEQAIHHFGVTDEVAACLRRGEFEDAATRALK